MRILPPPQGRRSWRCLSAAQLAAYVDGVDPQRDRHEQHLAGCSDCRHEVALLLRSETMPHQQVPPAWLARTREIAQPAHAFPLPKWASAAGVAAVAAGIILAGVFLTRPAPVQVAVNHAAAPQPPQSAPESAQREEVRNLAPSSVAPVVLSPGDGAYVHSAFEVRWQRLPTAVAYDVRILNAAGDTLWRANTAANRLAVPSSAALHSGSRYFVLISAKLPSGRMVRARAVPFQIAPEQQEND